MSCGHPTLLTRCRVCELGARGITHGRATMVESTTMSLGSCKRMALLFESEELRSPSAGTKLIHRPLFALALFLTAAALLLGCASGSDNLPNEPAATGGAGP